MFIHILITTSCFLLFNLPITRSDVSVHNISNALIKDIDDEPASFGPTYPADGLKGYITTTNPANACQKISPPPNILTKGYHWIALIPRTKGNSSCEFDLKVQNAQNANFSGVIVYNYEDSLITMGKSGRNVHIPSTLITYSDGLALISRYLYNVSTVNSTPMYHVRIVGEKPFQFTIYIIVFSAFIGVSFFALVVFLLIRCYIDRRRTERHRLPRSLLKQLRIKKFVKGDPWEVCVICLDDFEVGAKLRILPCEHGYHVKCIDPWLINNRRQCPVCKRYVFPDRDNQDDDEHGGQPQARSATEQTPLINGSETNASTDISSHRRVDGHGVVDVDDTVDDSLASSRTSTSQITTTEIIFHRPSINSRRYGSMQNSSNMPRAANFFVGSTSTTADDANAAAHSVVENVSDIETSDDERMHSVLTVSEDNPAYINDEESTTNTTNTHL